LATLARTECDRVASDHGMSSREQPPGAGLTGASGSRSDAAILRVVPSIRSEAGRASGATIGPADLCRVLAQKLLKHGARAVSRVVERRRMNRIRRNPAALRRALRSAESLLVMCQGNIIRSPFAMQLIRQALVGRAPVAVMSAGLGAVPGTPAHPTARRAASARSVDLSSHHASAALAEWVAA